ncbi:hypothetical protein I4F81_009362 [Pyropia yezoensis]|uniref:Uncharacterized protein n=1 Tax=Pyropia yezoensis TaxID=2788 RepID=A0ACC3C9E7_PYRYE|nr:hypothetical protein I4F81_009362 [Neopyropia yezoensis]
MGGYVMRQANVFDAVAVSRLTQGVCQKLREWDDQGCPGGIFPVDSSQQLPHVSSGDKTYLPMVTYENPDGNLSVLRGRRSSPSWTPRRRATRTRATLTCWLLALGLDVARSSCWRSSLW